MTDWPDDPFWTFSTRLYAARDVPEACLALQRRHGLDVNLVLFCLWGGRERPAAMETCDMGAALASVEEWHRHIVRALRGARDRMKTMPPPVDPSIVSAARRRVLDAELDCERIEQLALSRLLASPAAPPAADPAVAARALARYAAVAGFAFTTEDAAAVATLLAAAFGVAPDAAARLAAMTAAAR